MSKVKYYQIRKTIIEKNISVILNDSMGSVLELKNFDEAALMCQIMNANTDNNCKYELITINEKWEK
jgi:hypothetical protein